MMSGSTYKAALLVLRAWPLRDVVDPNTTLLSTLPLPKSIHTKLRKLDVWVAQNHKTVLRRINAPTYMLLSTTPVTDCAIPAGHERDIAVSGVKTLNDLTQLRKDHVLHGGCGPRTLQFLEDLLALWGLQLNTRPTTLPTSVTTHPALKRALDTWIAVVLTLPENELRQSLQTLRERGVAGLLTP